MKLVVNSLGIEENFESWWYQILAEKGFSPLTHPTTKGIHADMFVAMCHDTPALSTVKMWASDFKRWQGSLGEDAQTGGPATATSEDNIDIVHYKVVDDMWITTAQIANPISICREKVENILNPGLGVMKVSTWGCHVFWHLCQVDFITRKSDIFGCRPN